MCTPNEQLYFLFALYPEHAVIATPVLRENYFMFRNKGTLKLVTLNWITQEKLKLVHIISAAIK